MSREWTVRAVVAACALAAAIALGAASGVVPMAASTGHWAITEAFLTWAMRRSIATWSLGVTVPRGFDDADAVGRGAGAYEVLCVGCHGSPADPPLGVTAAMLPPPPTLDHAARTWSERELYTTIRHGLRFTGMPCWPAPRDDEAWDAVAFVRVLPTLDDVGYRALVEDPGDPRLARCTGCHGADGGGRFHAPGLAGQSATYLASSLVAYAGGDRPSGVMQAVASELDPDERVALARAFAAMSAASASPATPDPDAPPAIRGTEERPGCDGCHGPDRADAYPSLDGQDRVYLAAQLRRFAAGTRGGGPYGRALEARVHHLDDGGIAAVSAWYASRGRATAPGE